MVSGLALSRASGVMCNIVMCSIVPAHGECVWWQVNDRVGVKRGADGSMHVYINSDDMGVAASNIPKVGHRFIIM